MEILSILTILSLYCNNFVIGKETQGRMGLPIQKTSGVLRISDIWLNELEQSYKYAFEHQFVHLKYRDNSTVLNHNIPHESNSKCQNVSFFSFDQNRRLIEQFGYTTALNSTIADMLDNPRARIFQFEDHWGEFEDYHFSRSEREGMCSDLIKLGGRGSVFPFGKCVRLFETEQCRGWSLAVYPGSSNYHRLKLPRHVILKSIGPCLGNEFEGGSFNKSIHGFVVKNPEMRSYQPDLAMMFKHEIYLGRKKVFGEVRVNYLLGFGNRTENIVANPVPWTFAIHPKINVLERDYHKSLEQEYGDVLGCAIPTTIGGPGNESFNIFAANESGQYKWEEILLHHAMNNTKFPWSIVLHFVYENGNKTRPLFFYYYIIVEKHLKFEIKYGRIINGHRTNLRRAEPYSQVIPKFEYKGTATINLPQVLQSYSGHFKIRSYSSSNASLQSFKEMTKINPITNWNSFRRNNLMNDEVSMGNVTQSYLFNAQFQGMIKNPMVRLFSGTNLTGISEDFYSGLKQPFHVYKGCYNTKKQAIKSVETFGTCVRLFEDKDCLGWSFAIYRSGNNNWNRIIHIILKEVSSVGPCLEEEFVNATFVNTRIERQVVKDRHSIYYFPDLIQLGYFDCDNELRFKRNGTTSIFYCLGPKSRIDYMLTWIDQIGPAKSARSPNVEETEFYRLLEKKEGDIPCYAIPLELYGPANEPFNIFPISKSKVDDWAGIFPDFSEANVYLQIRIQLLFTYENDNSTRPQFVYYHFTSYIDTYVYYGRFNNV